MFKTFLSKNTKFTIYLVVHKDKYQLEGWAQDCSTSNIFLKPFYSGNFDLFVNNANLGAIAHTSNGT